MFPVRKGLCLYLHQMILPSGWPPQKTVMDQDSTAKHYLHPNRVSTWNRLIIDGIADVFSGGKQVGLTETEFKNFELLPENRTLT